MCETMVDRSTDYLSCSRPGAMDRDSSTCRELLWMLPVQPGCVLALIGAHLSRALCRAKVVEVVGAPAHGGL
jgi:hypothetical protein